MKQEIIEKCEAYHRGLMSDDDERIFADKLEKDAALNEYYNSYLLSMKLIDDEAIKLEIRKIHKDVEQSHDETYDSSTEIVKRNNRIIAIYSFLVAASVSLLGIAIWQVSNHSDPANLISSYFTPYPDVITVREDSSDLAMHYYSNEAYSQALSVLKTRNIKNDTVMLYLINCHLAMNDNIEYILFDYERDETKTFYQQIQWYLSLYYLKSKRKDLARTSLLQIKNNEYKYSEAQQLLSKI